MSRTKGIRANCNFKCLRIIITCDGDKSQLKNGANKNSDKAIIINLQWSSRITKCNTKLYFVFYRPLSGFYRIDHGSTSQSNSFSISAIFLVHKFLSLARAHTHTHYVLPSARAHTHAHTYSCANSVESVVSTQTPLEQRFKFELSAFR